MDNKQNYNPEEEYVGDYKPLVELSEVETVTGEEDVETLGQFRSKFYRWDDE